MKIDVVIDDGSSKEDACLVKDNLCGVFDGFDSLVKFKDRDGRKGGLVAALAAKEVFSKNKGALTGLALEANQKIRDFMSNYGVDVKRKINVWGTGFAVVRIKDSSFEWAQIADSLILVVYKDGSFKLLVTDYDHDKEVLGLWKKFALEKRENIRALIEDSLTVLRNTMNIEYGCLNGDEKAVGFMRSGEESLDNVSHILLFTDGIFIPKEDPSRGDDWAEFVKLFLAGGLENVKNYVRDLEKNDPKCWTYPRYKQYDDITAISISFDAK